MSKFKSEFFNLMLERGFYNQCTNEDGFDTYLYECEKAGKPAVGYLGSDPTGDSLHVGHIVPLMMMRWFQKCGHKPLTLVGGATARIGDPSGKDKLRPFLSEETLQHNIEGLKKSFGKFLKFGNGANDAIMVDNWDWFKDINYLAFLRDIGTCYSVNRMLTMDSVKPRLEREQPMSFLEFNYMLLQGYDFCVLYNKYGCRAQIAGSDQWGNITSGTELGRRRYDVELFGFTSPIITDSNGKKMGKSEGNAVWINEEKLPAYDYYQYFRNIGDAEIFFGRKSTKPKKFWLLRRPKSAGAKPKPRQRRTRPSKPLKWALPAETCQACKKPLLTGSAFWTPFWKSALLPVRAKRAA